MTDDEIRSHLDSAVTHLKATTVTYRTWFKNEQAGKYTHGSQWGSAFADLKAIRDALTTPPPVTDVIDVFPGEWVTKYSQAKAGSVFRLRNGNHSKITLDKSFPADQRVTIMGESLDKCIIRGGISHPGGGGYILRGVHPQILASDISNHDDIHPRSVDMSGPVHDVRYEKSIIEGGYIGFSPYCSSPNWATNIELDQSDLFGQWGDWTHPNGVKNLRITRCKAYGMLHLSSEHHDFVQPQRVDGLIIDSNEVSWPEKMGSGIIGQCIMLSGNADPAGNKNIKIINNLFHHYPGRPINMNYSQNVLIAFNTMQDAGDGIMLTFGDGMSGVTVVNNILGRAYIDNAAPANFIMDGNWLTDNYSGNTQGTNYRHGDPKFIDRVKYALATDSPARGFGTHMSIADLPMYDMDGKPRTSLVPGCRV